MLLLNFDWSSYGHAQSHALGRYHSQREAGLRYNGGISELNIQLFWIDQNELIDWPSWQMSPHNCSPH